MESESQDFYLNLSKEDQNIVYLFEKQLKLSPDDTALIFEQQRMSKRELLSKVNILSNHFINIGIQPGSYIVVSLENSFELVISLLGILKVGAVYIPLSPLSYPQDRMNAVLKELSVSYLIASSSQEFTFISENNNIQMIDIKEVISRPTKDNRNHQTKTQNQSTSKSDRELNQNNFSNSYHHSKVIHPNDIYAIFFTSGSTGIPKGCPFKQSSLINRLLWGWRTFPYNKSEVCCLKTIISFVDSIVEILSPICSGIPLIISPSNYDTSSLLNLVHSEKVTRLLLVPSLLKQILVDDQNKRLLENLNILVISGEVIPTQLAKRFKQKYPNTRYINLFFFLNNDRI
jgi:acyl-CoA synthetase (AMP-forming)/AMP-acid ligase II